MFLEIGVILLIIWLLGIFFFPLGGWIYLALILAIIAVIWHFVSGSKAAKN